MTQNKRNRILATVLFILKDDNILLGYKKRGFGKDKWNGFGGKVGKNESILEAANRELQEEAGILAVDPQHVGQLEFEFDPKYEEKILDVHVFKATEYKGEIIESDEMRPKWFKISEIPFDQMWKDDTIWFPYLLNGKKFKAKIVFSDFETIIDSQIQQVDSL